METNGSRAIAIVGTGAFLPDAPSVEAFWKNIKEGRYSITEVDPTRWDPKLYYDADRSAPDRTYSTIGGWVRESTWEPAKWKLAVPPRVVDAMDESQRWAIACTRAALEDYGFPKRPLDNDRTAVILGNAMAGEKHYFTALRLYFPEYAQELAASPSFAALPEKVREIITRELHDRMASRIPDVTEDTMPGELSNCIAGRIANIFNFHGPNYVVDAACASAMAAFSAAVDGLIEHDFDVAVTGGIDRNMGASTFVKFCKIGALSATGTRPYAEGADGFVMGEGAAIFLLKRLADAERDQDRIYAVIRGIGGASDGKGKGITAPNPVGQKLAIERGWKNAGISPNKATYIEGHGTSTTVGDVVEAESMAEVLRGYSVPVHSVPLGSVKSNIGHLKGAAGAAGILKAALALRDKVLPPSVNCEHLNPNIDFAHSPLYVNTELRPWNAGVDDTRRAAVSAFGFGGTNFHVVMEEHMPGRLTGNGKHSISVGEIPAAIVSQQVSTAKGPIGSSSPSYKAPLRGVLVVGGENSAELVQRLQMVEKDAAGGRAPSLALPAGSDLRAKERVAIDYADSADLVSKSKMALKALALNQPAMWKALRAQGIYRGHGAPAKVAFLYTGQGSQYVNMLRPLRKAEAIVRDTFVEADEIMKPLLGKPLSEFIFVDSDNAAAVAKAEDDLRQTEITQPAVLATDQALTRLLAAYGIEPDMTMGHSLGEYGALVGAGALPFKDALEAVSARGRGMTAVAMNDNGKMAAVFAPIEEIERIIKTIDGYVVIANINSSKQGVIGGASKAVEQAILAFQKAGYEPVELPVSHAFHTSIVAGAGVPLRRELERLQLRSPRIPVVANVDGEFYPMGPDALPKMLDILTKQVASPVQFVKGLKTLYAAGARIFVEVGPKKALQGFAEDVLGSDSEVISIFTNHPKVGDVVAFNQALCALYAGGLGQGLMQAKVSDAVDQEVAIMKDSSASSVARASNGERYSELGHLFAEVVDRGWNLLHEGQTPAQNKSTIVITGASLGLPGTEHIFDDGNIGRLLKGEPFIDAIPTRFRRAMVDKNITRLVKSDNGAPTFETINDLGEAIKLAGRGKEFDLGTEFGIPAERIPALDRATRLAIGVGIDALRDAGIPLIMRYRTTSKGTKLPERWVLPEPLRDDTGVIFGSAFPGYDSFADEMSRFWADRARRDEIAALESIRARTAERNGHSAALTEIDRRLDELKLAIERSPYVFDRRFLFRILSMGHSQFAEYIGARGPNTAINSACATTAQAVALAEDWIHAGRCKRVIVVSADDVTSDHLLEWIGAGFLATGAAATDEVLEDAALPFDRRRHGMLIGMGAAGLIVESAEEARKRGIAPICEVLAAVTANSAFHGTRLDVQHIGQVMEELVSQAEKRHGISRRDIAEQTVFVSHETYTPARGGSASAEIYALRKVFGDVADKIVIANTKGFTGHAMAAGIEDVLAVKTLETGMVPPVANFKEIDPELGALNLSKGGAYPVQYALRLGAGFGSQISMTLLRWVKTKNGVRRSATDLGYEYRVLDQQAWSNWLTRLSGHPESQVEVVSRTLRIRTEAAAEATKTKAAEVVAQPVVEAVLESRTLETSEVQIPETPVAKVAIAVQAKVPEKTALADESVKQRVLAVVAEKTGYPTDMLDLDLDLEADLGVDTVKQAEMFAAVREIYNIPRDESRKLRDYPTLAHVIQFVYEKRPDLATAASNDKPAVQPVAREMVSDSTAKDVKPTTDDVKERVLEVVAQKTGYPKDMLDLDLDLEADLGVDTVKQAEMFAAVREIYSIPRDENRKLRDYPTLAHVIQFVYEKRPDLSGAQAQAVPAEQPTTPVELPDESVKEKVLEIVAEKTGYPKDMLDLDLDLEADLGVDTVKQAEMFAAVRSIYNIPRDENRKLRDYPTLAHVIRFVYENRPELGAVQTEPVLEVAQPAAAAAVTPVSTDSIQEKVLEIVAEKTGYPKDMLDLDLDLEADLGVDTVKQAEMFASVRAAYNIPRDANLKLRDFPTLAHVIKFARDRAGAPPSQPVTSASAMKLPDHAAAARTNLDAASFEAADRIPRRVPVPVLRPPLSMCKNTGITLDAGRRVIIAPDENGVSASLTQKLREKGIEVLLIEPTLDPNAIGENVKHYLSGGPVHGVYWLPALDAEQSITKMDLPAWRAALGVRVKALYATMRVLHEQIAVQGTFLVCGTRLGGNHGYDEVGAANPMGGAVTGFTKAYKRERMNALVKAVDFEAGCKPTDVADLLIAETLRDPGVIEVGYKGSLRWSVGLEEKPANDGRSGMKLDRNSVFVVTGAAGSIVSAITADLARASGGIFYLLDVVPEPDSTNPDLARFVSEKESLKLDLFRRMQGRGERATPAMVEKELAALERAVAAKNAMDAVKVAGGTARYFSVNLTDTASVAAVMDRVRKEHGRIDVLLHAAGMERSHFLPDKDAREFELVFDVKADGWFNLLRAIGSMPVGATVAFSSIAGRFGNAGQTDYSAANDLLCKITSSFRTARPDTRGIVIDWTAWCGIGMATRGSIPKMMEAAGIDMLPPEAGVPLIRRELTVGGTRGELVIAQRLGSMTAELDETGGIETTALRATSNARLGPMVGKIGGLGLHRQLNVETTLDPAAQPFLRDHKINGTPVLPGVMGIEAFAEAASSILPADWRVARIEDVNFLAPVKFYRGEPRTLTIRAVFEAANDQANVDCELIGARTLPNQTEPQLTTHFTGRVRLERAPALKSAAAFRAPMGATIDADLIYQLYFHGAAYQVLERAWWDGERVVGLFNQALPVNHEPAERPLYAAPRLIELCFQTAGVWEMGVQGRMGLPQHIDNISFSEMPDERQGPFYSVVIPHAASGTFDAEIIDSFGKQYLQMTGYRTVALADGVKAKSLQALQALMSLEAVA